MDLTLSELASLLKVSKKTIYRWLGEKAIPAYKIHHQFRFNRNEIEDWIKQNRIEIETNEASSADIPQTGRFVEPAAIDLIALLKRGGIFYKVEGSTLREVIINAVDVMALPDELDRDDFRNEILIREVYASTGIGNGIAVPHTRHPVRIMYDHQSLSICFLDRPVDFAAFDGKPVDVVIIPLCATLASHLQAIMLITRLCRQQDFVQLLRNQTGRKELLEWIERNTRDYSSGT